MSQEVPETLSLDYLIFLKAIATQTQDSKIPASLYLNEELKF